MKKIITIISLSFFQLIYTQNIFACLCFAPSVCRAYEQADAVVIASVKSYEPIKIPRTLSNNGTTSVILVEGQNVLLEIEKIYKGVLSKQISISQPKTSCHWIFEEKSLDKRHLFYLDFNKISGSYEVSVCDGSGLAENKINDLNWLDNLPDSLKRTRIAGGVFLNDDTNMFLNIPNIPIKIIGKNKSYSLVTDKNGLFEIWDIPVGKYSIVPSIQKDFKFSWGFQKEININRSSCSDIYITIEKKKDEK